MQPTVVTSSSGTSSKSREGFHHHSKTSSSSSSSKNSAPSSSSSPVKPTPTTPTVNTTPHYPAAGPTLQAGAFPQPYPTIGVPGYPTAAIPAGFPAPPPAHAPFTNPAVAAAAAAFPYYSGVAAPGAAEFRPQYHPLYPQAYPHAATQPRPYYLTPVGAPALTFNPTGNSAAASPAAPTAPFFGGYTPAATYQYPPGASGSSTGIPILALAPTTPHPPSMGAATAAPAHPTAEAVHPTPPMPTPLTVPSVPQPSMIPSAGNPFPGPTELHHQSSASSFSYSLPADHHSKNASAGSQAVGEGPSKSYSATGKPTPNVPTATVQGGKKLQQQHQLPATVATPSSKAPQPPIPMAPTAPNKDRPILPKHKQSKATATSKSAMAAQLKIPQPPTVVPTIVGQTTILPVSPMLKQQQMEQKQQQRLESQRAIVTTTPIPPTTKSSLRDYRRPKAATLPTPANGGKSTATTSTTAPSNQAPIVSNNNVRSLADIVSLPTQQVTKRPGVRVAASLDELLPNKKPKLHNQQQQQFFPGAHPQLPRGLTITEIDKSVKKLQQPVISIPDIVSVTARPAKPTSSVASSSSLSSGHPGLPNGLLRMATAATSNSSLLPPATKVVPKDLKSQLALSKIGIGDAVPSRTAICLKPPETQTPKNRPLAPTVSGPTAISMTMAQSAASAVPTFKPVHSNKKSKSLSPGSNKSKESKKRDSPNKKGTSPNSSRSVEFCNT